MKIKHGYMTIKVDNDVHTPPVISRHFSVEAGPPTLEAMQEVVGGLITPAFTIPSPYRRGVSITAYVNDEGILMNLPARIYMTHGNYAAPLFGNMIILGLRERDGESVLLTINEMNYIEFKCTLACVFNDHAVLDLNLN